jgi:chemotaxis protein methyltransferase CheR
MTTDAVNDQELRALLDSLFEQRHYDFRSYAPASMRRRVSLAVTTLGCKNIPELHEKVRTDHVAFDALLSVLTVQVSEMFRDPAFYTHFRREIVPELASYPSFRLWVAGCSTGEEVYSLAIILAEEGVLERALIYATDINPAALVRARTGIFAVDRVAGFSKNYFASGGTVSLSHYYRTAYDAAAFDRSLCANVVFADHSLATDAVFAEVQLITCRNVLIYFDKQLQTRAFGLFRDALCRRGFLGLGSRETLQFSSHAQSFKVLHPKESWYRRC